jgi:phosphoglycerol transferase
MVKRLKFSKLISTVLIVCIGAIAIFDMVGYSNVGRDNELKYEKDKTFISDVEDRTPEGTMVFQLPFVLRSAVHSPFKLPRYEHYIPYIHSESLKWSYKAMPGSAAERWQHYVSELPTDQMLKHLVINDFRGVYIDLRGYSDDEGYAKIEEVQAVTGTDYIVCEFGYMVYFYIGDFADSITYNLSEKERSRYRWDIDSSIIDINELLTADSGLHWIIKNGWSYVEEWGVWSDGHTAEIAFSIAVEEASDLELVLYLMTFPDPTFVNIYFNEINKEELILPRDNYELIIPFSMSELIDDDGIFYATIRIEIENPQSPASIMHSTDTRDLGVGLMGIRVRQK